MLDQAATQKLKAKYAASRSIRAFIEAELQINHGNRAEAARAFMDLIMVSETARTKLVTNYVQRVYDGLRAKEAKKRESIAKAQRLKETGTKIKPEPNMPVDEFRTYIRDRLRHAVHDLPDAQLCKLASGNRKAVVAFIKTLAPYDVVKTWDEDDWEDAEGGLKWLWGRRQGYRRYQEACRRTAATKEKAASFDRMVMALDAIQVGSKLLGDCTGADLLREAVKLEEFAKEATAQSTFYRELAAIVGKTVTVREAGDRAGIVGLLTHQFADMKEAA